MAYDLNGTDQAISLGNSSTLNPTAFTVAGWVNYDAHGSQSWLFARDDETDGRSFSLGAASDGTFRMQINGSSVLPGFTAVVPTGTWAHVAGGGLSGEWKVYLDGALDDFAANVITPNATTGPTTIGQRSFSGQEGWVNGRVAEFGMWDVLLTPVEILTLARGFCPLLVRPESLLAYVPLVRDLVNVLGATPTLIGSPTVAVHPRIIMPRRRRGAARLFPVPPAPPETLFAQACL